MNILALDWNNTKRCAQLITAEDTLATRLRTAVIISLFTDARVSEDEQPRLQERRGYWGDFELDGDQSLGSKLWLYEREKLTQSVINSVRDEAQRALVWMLSDYPVIAINVEAKAQPDNQTLAFEIDFTLNDGQTLNIVFGETGGNN